MGILLPLITIASLILAILSYFKKTNTFTTNKIEVKIDSSLLKIGLLIHIIQQKLRSRIQILQIQLLNNSIMKSALTLITLLTLSLLSFSQKSKSQNCKDLLGKGYTQKFCEYNVKYAYKSIALKAALE